MRKKRKIALAWRDADYFRSLSDAERAEMPANPAGIIDLDAEEMRQISAADPYTLWASICWSCGGGGGGGGGGFEP